MDPILSELSKTMIDKISPTSTNPVSDGGAGFKSVLDQTLQNSNATTDKLMELVDSGFGNQNQMTSTSADSIKVEFAQNKEVGEVAPKQEQFFDFLGEFNREQNKMEELLSFVGSKRTMTPQELCAVQAAIQKASMGSEVLVRGTELTVKAVQSTINLQVG